MFVVIQFFGLLISRFVVYVAFSVGFMELYPHGKLGLLHLAIKMRQLMMVPDVFCFVILLLKWPQV